MRARARDGGQVLVIFALSLVALFAAAGLAFDIGRFYAEKRYLQNAADAGALAVATALIRGESDSNARAEGMAVISRNFAGAPNGITPWLPPGAGSEVYASGHAGEAAYLLEGILISGGDVRVAVHSHIPYTFGRVVGLQENVIYGKARVKLEGDLLPIAVRRYINAPGPGVGAYPCLGLTSQFMSFFSTANTSCLGTDTDASLRTIPNAGAAFNSTNPADDPVNHGPVVEILGQGADPDNGADFRGFVALDIRNFQTATSQLYYNGVTTGTNSNTLKDMQAAWILAGGYPGPMFPAAVSPPDANDQVAIMSGNSTGVAVESFGERFAPGDEILVAVYPGIVMQIPDFSMTSPGTIAIGSSATLANVGSFRVGKNQAFSGTVTVTTVADAGDVLNPMVTGTLVGGATPITYSPNGVNPSLGAGTSVSMTDMQTSGATPGVFTLWMRGEAGSPYLTVKYQPFSLNVGGVSRDFVLSSSSSSANAANPGDTVSYTLNLKRTGAAFGGTVALALEALPGETLPAGLGAVSFTPATVTPAAGSGASVALSINTGTVSPGVYDIVVRATGMNGDSTPRKVTHLLPLKLEVATSSSGGNQEYVDIVGFAVMRVAAIDSNTVSAYAITEVIADPNDSRLRRGQVARLVPWT